ncbi:uncharacterized protein PG986_001064 [Apiospora aurea]|uniref:Uncharacterized protein n=1 Tax=Apiospora aurea TaxID=335848 RepID=A0ABR1QVR5_9PEZI
MATSRWDGPPLGSSAFQQLETAAIRESRGNLGNVTDESRSFVLTTAVVSTFAFCPVLLLFLALAGNPHRRRRRLVDLATWVQYALPVAVVGADITSMANAGPDSGLGAATGATFGNKWFAKHTFSDLVREHYTAFQVQHCQTQMDGGSVAIYVTSVTSILTVFGPVIRLLLLALGW